MRIPFQISINSMDVMGVMDLPTYIRKNQKIVIMCSGINGDRVEQHRMGVKTAEYAQSNGLVFVRFDYRNQGISQGTFGNISIKEKTEDLDSIIDFVTGCFYDTKVLVYLIGFSDGAKIVSSIYKKHKSISGIILWNPIFKVEKGVKEESYSKPVKSKLFIDPISKKPYKKLLGLQLNLKLLREIENDNTISNLTETTIPVFYVFGEKDKLTEKIQNCLSHIYNKSKDEITYIRGAGHVFEKTDYENEAISRSIKWILEHEMFVGDEKGEIL